MDIIIYHPNSFGGTYEYAVSLFKAFRKANDINNCRLALPSNASFYPEGVIKMLVNDKPDYKYKYLSRWAFLFRSFINPLILFFFLIRRNGNVVIFNEFDQLSSILWAPLMLLIKRKKHTYSIILHDPDRDHYFFSRKLSEKTMNWVMSVMDLAFYHEILPDKIYYHKNRNCKYINIPHGVYETHEPEHFLMERLLGDKSNFQYISILGNIRPEKNYTLAIQSLPDLPGFKLIIAGRPANSRVDTGFFKNLAHSLDVADRIIWVEHFLNDHQLAAVIDCSDVILLNYSKSFKSQSGILFLTAPYRKKLIISDIDSALSKLAHQFKLGVLIEPDSVKALINGVKSLYNNDLPHPQWNEFMEYSSWERNTRICIDSFRSINIHYQ